MPYTSAAIPSHRPGKIDNVDNVDVYQDCVRLDFFYTCAWCGEHEDQFGQGVVHWYEPYIKRADYSELLWTCEACDRSRDNAWPTAREMNAGFEFVNPRVEPLSKHLYMDAAIVKPHTTQGAYMIDAIHLNAELKVRRRHFWEAMRKHEKDLQKHPPDKRAKLQSWLNGLRKNFENVFGKTPPPPSQLILPPLLLQPLPRVDAVIHDCPA